MVYMKKFKSTRYLLLIAILGVLVVAGCVVPGVGDMTAPSIDLVSPANLAANAVINTKIVATFSESMDPATISATTFTVTRGGTAVAGTVSYAGTSATFTPGTVLLGGTTYTATVSTGMKDVAGNALASAYSWSFTTGTILDTTKPTVGSPLPLPSATAVAINTTVSAIFSEPMDPLTMTTANFTLKKGAEIIAGAVTHIGNTVTFTPAAGLTATTVYTATITTGVRDLAGNAMAAAYVWTFTTGAGADATAPTVTSTVPVNAATGVPVNNNITATFSEPMAPLTLNSVTFTVKQGTTPVTGTVLYAGTTATFNPAATLAGGTVYTATITTGAKDIAGNALAVNKVWTFTTVALVAGPAPVLLGSSSNFTILAKTTVTSAGATVITGNVGVSPAAATFLTGFSLTLAGDHATSTQVVGGGFLYAADMAPPTPTVMTTAVADMQTAYTDAAGRAAGAGANLNLGAGTIPPSTTLAPGTYTWGSTVQMPDGVTLSGGANDTWLFQITGDLNLASAKAVTLAGTAQAKNIFWQVSGQATFQSGSSFKGIILSQTSVTLVGNAILVGRALAQTAVILGSGATVTAP